MELAKPRVDIGLATDNLDPLLAFWQKDVRLPFDHVLKVSRSQDQHRHDANGSVVKINHHRVDPLPQTPPSGYLELLLARDGAPPISLQDPDGNAVSIVPMGRDGVTQIGVRIGARNLDAHRAFYGRTLGFPEEPYRRGAAFRCGESIILLEESPDAPSDAGIVGRGWRYITFQVRKVDAAHAAALEAGAREAMAPRTLGESARISMIRDPDGNWIELSQRASVVGRLD